MSTVLHPAGPQPARVYWVRRLVVIGALVVVIAVVWAMVSGPGAGDADGAETGTDTEVTEGDTTEPSAGGSPIACAPADLTVTLTADTRSYPAPAQPILTVGVTNSGAAACTVDGGEAAREILITSGSDRIWSSADCPADTAAERLLLLEPGARDEVAVTWPRVRSAAECPDGLPEPRPGTYNAVVSVLGSSSAPAVFELG